jgi:hypothetical protein
VIELAHAKGNVSYMRTNIDIDEEYPVTLLECLSKLQRENQGT